MMVRAVWGGAGRGEKEEGRDGVEKIYTTDLTETMST